MGALRAIAEWFFPPRIVDREGAEELLTRAAANLAHKASVGYCQVKAGPYHRNLFADPEFLTRMERCRWLSFAAILADFVELTEGHLREAAAGRQGEVGAWLAGFYESRLAPGPLRGPKVEDASRSGAMAQRLATAQRAAPRPVAAYGEEAAMQVFKSIPFHPAVSRLDFPMILGMVRFGTIAFHDELQRRTDAAAVVASLPASSADPGKGA